MRLDELFVDEYAQRRQDERDQRRECERQENKEDYIRRECDRQDLEEMLQRQGMSEFADGTPLPPDDGINTIIEPI